MRILATADWQASLKNLDRCQLMLDNLISGISVHKVDLVLHLGDFKEDFNPIDQRVTNFLLESAKRITAACPMIAILGNHDRITTRDDSPSCLPILAAGGAQVFESTVRLAHNWGVAFQLAPWRRDQEEFKKSLIPRVPEKDKLPTILAFHGEIQGCHYSPSQRGVGSGVGIDEFTPHKYLICLGGHIHYRQQLYDGKIQYVGSPFAQDWSECNQCKGHLLVTIEKGKAEVTEIGSGVPGWYDPTMAGFPLRAPTAFWKDTHVRIHVPIGDPTEMQREKLRAEDKYPGAVIHIKTELQSAEAPELSLPQGGDGEIIRNYVTKVPPDAKVATVDQCVTYIKSKVHGSTAFGTSITLDHVYGTNTLCFSGVGLDLGYPGITVVTGENRDWPGRSNGAGKSSLLSLPVIALFGRTMKNQTAEAWRWQGTPDDMASIVGLSAIVGGKKLVIERGRNPVRLCVSVGGNDVSMGSVHASQDLIEKVTGITWSTLINSLYVGQQEVATILTGTDKERKELFSRFLGLDRYLDAKVAMQPDVTVTTRAIDDLDDDILATETRGKLYSEHLATEEKTKADGKPIATLKKEYYDLQLDATKLKATLALMETYHGNVRQVLNNVKGKLGEAVGTQKTLKQHLQKLREAEASRICPTCGQRIMVGHLDKHRKELLINETTIAKQVEDLRKEEARQEFALGEAIREEDELRQKITKTNLRVQELNYEIAAEGRNQEITARFRKIKQDMKRCKQILRVHKAYRRQLQRNLEFLRYCQSAVGRDGIPAYLCQMVCPALNAAASRFSDLLSDGEIGVGFTLAVGELDVSVSNQHGGAGIQDQSMGELRLAGLIAILAFREVLVRCNILVLDEPGEGLDRRNAEAFAEGLSAIASHFGSVYVITHNPFILDRLEAVRRINVIKENGISRVEVV